MEKTNKHICHQQILIQTSYYISHQTLQAELECKVLTIVNIFLMNQFGNFNICHNMTYNSHILRPKTSLDYGSNQRTNQPEIAIAVVNAHTLRGESQILVKEQHSVKQVD